MYFIVFVVIIIALIILFIKINNSNIKGYFGELTISGQLSKLNRNEYKVINDLTIIKDTYTSQIDHIVVSIFGIYVIETKNYNGWIHGSENTEYWTQSIYKIKNKFYNPVKQNWAHIYALRDILIEYQHIKYFPIVVFAGSAKLKNVFSQVPVVYENQLLDTILNNKNPNLSFEEVQGIVDIISKYKLQNGKANIEHINQIRNKVEKKSEDEKLLICPKCRNSLIIKQGKYGKFYGCSGFPRCKFTKNIR